jgi:hypothetical protein
MLDPSDAVTALRLRLREAGYHPVPAEGKVPPLKGWQAKFDTGPEEIRLWQRSWHMARNTGVLAKFAPGLDIDLLDEDACEAIEALVNKTVSDDDSRTLVRVGQHPKRLIPFRTAAPFKKLVLNVLAPNGAAGKIEFLGEGQHYVCDGIHPATHLPYIWHGANCLADVPLAELPLIRDAQHAQELLDKIGAMLVVGHGYRIDQPKAKASNGHQGGEHADIARLVDNVLNGRDLHDSLRDYAMSLIGSGTSQRQAAATLRALMDASQIPHDDRWKERRAEIPQLVKSAAAQRATRAGAATAASDIKVGDFVAYMPAHSYIFKPTREMWPAGAVNARVPVVLVPGQQSLSPAAWLDANVPVEQMTWVPGEAMLVKDRLIADGGWIERKGCTVFNLYRPPAIVPKAGDAAPWLNHVSKVYAEAADHIVRWLAQRVQHPDVKINHALVLGGKQGIGKDTLLEPIKHAVGPWNFVDVTPRHLLGRFNGYAKAVILRVSEARDLGDVDRYAFYDHMKLYTAAPPDVLRVDEKNLREYAVFNICGVVITSNHKADGIFLPIEQGGLRARLLDAALSLLRRRGQRGRRRVLGDLRPVGLRPEGTTAEDRGVLGGRRLRPRIGRRRACRRARPARQPGRHHAGPGAERGRGRLQDLAPRPQAPPANPAPVRSMRIRAGPEPGQ